MNLRRGALSYAALVIDLMETNRTPIGCRSGLSQPDTHDQTYAVWRGVSVSPLNPDQGTALGCANQKPLYTLRFFLFTCVSVGYTLSIKDSGLRIRIERELHEGFIEVCRQQDRPAAQVIREFMRKYIAENKARGQEQATKVKSVND